MHKVKLFSGIIICSILLSCVFILFNNKTCSASENFIYVDMNQKYPSKADGTLYNPYKSISDAVLAANDGDIIKVLPGEYGGDLVIDKSVTITTEGVADSFIQSGSLNTYMIRITANSVSLEGFEICDWTNTTHRKGTVYMAPGTSDIRIINNYFNVGQIGYAIHIDESEKAVIRNNIINNTKGILLENSNSNSIDNNIIRNSSDFNGIKLISSNSNLIYDNIIKNNTYGIYARSSNENSIINNSIYDNSNSAIHITDSSNNIVNNNYVNNNANIGISLGSTDSTTHNNTITNNYIGINLECTNSTIWDNDIHSSSLYGIQAKANSKNNLIYNNSFRDNQGLSHANELGNNKWDNGTIGNYWDDFYGPDPNNLTCKYPPDSDVYHYTKGGVIDNYPKGIFNRVPTVNSPNPENLEEQVDKQPTLSVIPADPDPLNYRERLDVNFYYVGLDGSHNYIGTHQNVESGGRASKWFSSLDTEGSRAYSYKGLGYDYVGVWFVEVEDQYYKITSDEWIFSTINTPVNNQKPTVEFNIPESAQLGDQITFDGSDCNDSDGEIVFYRWSFGDDTSVINEISPTHSYENPGDFEVSLVVVDNNGSSNIKDSIITIYQNTNRPPVAVINGPYNGNARKSITFLSVGSNDPDIGDSITYNWNFGDGKTSTDKNPTHKYSSVGNYTVTLTVVDQSGETDAITTYALIKSSSSDNDSPGFELLSILIPIMLIVYIKKRNKK